MIPSSALTYCSDERETTTKRLEELEGDCSSLRSQLVEMRSEREMAEGERKEIETKTTEEKELRDAEVQRLETELSSKQEDLQAKDKLIQKVGTQTHRLLVE